jgi:hypothetical protein
MDAVMKNIKHPDRISLAPSAIGKLSLWTEQINDAAPGTNVTRTDLVHWLIETASEKLSSADMKALQEKFYDSVKHARWILKQATLAKANGQKINIKIHDEKVERSQNLKGRGRKNKALSTDEEAKLKEPNS